MVSKQSVLVISVLDAREMGRYKDLSKFDKGHIVMTGSKYLWNIKVCGFLPVSRGDNLPTVARGGTNHKLATSYQSCGHNVVPDWCVRGYFNIKCTASFRTQN